MTLIDVKLTILTGIIIFVSIVYIKDKMKLYNLTKFVSPCCGEGYSQIDHTIEHSDCCQAPLKDYPYSFKCPTCKKENYITLILEEYYCEECLEAFFKPVQYCEYMEKMNEYEG